MPVLVNRPFFHLFWVWKDEIELGGIIYALFDSLNSNLDEKWCFYQIELVT